MPLVDISYQNAALDAIVGTWPASGAVYRLYDADPTTGGLEVPAAGGYAPVPFVPADWAAAADGEKTTTAPVSFPTSTDAWGAVATYWGVTTSAGVLIYSAELDAEIEVDAAGTDVSISPALFFDDIL